MTAWVYNRQYLDREFRTRNRDDLVVLSFCKVIQNRARITKIIVIQKRRNLIYTLFSFGQHTLYIDLPFQAILNKTFSKCNIIFSTPDSSILSYVKIKIKLSRDKDYQMFCYIAKPAWHCTYLQRSLGNDLVRLTYSDNSDFIVV